MDQLPDWASPTMDLTKPSAARMYDYYLGGAHNFAVDRELGRKALDLFPDGPLKAQVNRAFLHRAVQYMLDAGIRQFLDVGSGIPTSGNVHEVAQAAVPGARVLYVDVDPVAVAHSELILSDNPDAGVLQADLRRPLDILDSDQAHELLDLSRPLGVLMFAVLHFVAEDSGPVAILDTFRERVVPGSYLAVTHATAEQLPDAIAEVSRLYQSTATPLTFRSRDRIRELLADWELVEPGVVWAPEWHPDWPDEVGDDPAATMVAAAVARKP